MADVICVLSLVVILVTANSAPAAAEPRITDRRLGEVEAFVEREAQRARLPGVAFAVSDRSGVLIARGHGMADPAGTPIDADTPFQIGSLTKSFTALAIVQLAAAGKLELDAPVENYLPGFRAAGTGPAAPITVRHLLNQTSGIPVSAGFGSGSRDDRVAQLHALASDHRAAAPGTAFEYSNANYELLGLIVEQVSGVSYAEQVQGAIFAPLGMSHSDVDPAAAVKRGLAHGHQNWLGVNVSTRAVISPCTSTRASSTACASSGRRCLTSCCLAAVGRAAAVWHSAWRIDRVRSGRRNDPAARQRGGVDPSCAADRSGVAGARSASFCMCGASLTVLLPTRMEQDDRCRSALARVSIGAISHNSNSGGSDDRLGRQAALASDRRRRVAGDRRAGNGTVDGQGSSGADRDTRSTGVR